MSNSKSSANDDVYRISKFTGKPSEDYTTWRLRAVIALKGKGFWSALQKKECAEDIKEKSTALIVNALGDTPLRVCSDKLDDPMGLLTLLDARYASCRTTSRVSLLTSLYTKRFNGKDHMSKYIDEFESLFGQLERMGAETKVPDSHKAPLLLASLGTHSLLESSVAALRLRDIDKLTWEAVTADLIQEWTQLKGKDSNTQPGRKHGRHCPPSCTHPSHERFRRRQQANRSESYQSKTCDFCGANGHNASECYVNPSSSKCKLSDKAKKSLKANTAGTPEKEKGKKKKSLHFGSSGIHFTLADKYHELTNIQVTSWKPDIRNAAAVIVDTSQISAGSVKASSNIALIDSGASTSMFKKPIDAYTGTYRKGSNDVVQLAAGSKPIKCLGTGTLRVNSIELPGSLHVNELNNTLISVGEICDQNKIVAFTKNEGVVLDMEGFNIEPDKVIAIAKRSTQTGLYEFPLPQYKAMRGSKVSAEIQLWHNRLVHLNEKSLQSLYLKSKDIPELEGNLTSCHPCLLGKAKHSSFDSHFEPAEYPGKVVHSDLCGPLPKSLDGRKYFVTFMDQNTRFTHVMGLTAKSEVEEAYELYSRTPIVEKYFKQGIERLHSDGGGEYQPMSNENSTLTTPDTPQHNPFAERVNRTFMEPVRVILEQAGLSAKYWEYALDHVAYVKNRLPHSALNMSPFESITGKKPTLKHIRVFGCASFVYNETPKSKAHARAEPGIMLGCDDNGVYMVERLSDRKLLNSVHVTFDEASFPGLEDSDSSSSGESSDWEGSEGNESSESIETPFPDPDSRSSSDSELENRFPSRNRKKPDRLGFSAEGKVYNANSGISIPITTTDMPSINEAMNSTNSEIILWEKAIEEELEALNNMGTWEKVSKHVLKENRALPSHIILKIKRNENGLPERFKARVVAGGHLQVMGRDCEDVYAPVVDYSMVLLTLAISLQMNWVQDHVDVKSAFLNGDIDRDIYVSHPYNLPSKFRRGHVYKLRKALYGLRQSPKCWFLKLRGVLINKLVYTQLKTDGCIFIKSHTNGTEIILTIIICYVDDIIFISSNQETQDKEILWFLREFDGTKEELHWYLAVRIQSKRNTLEFSQRSYIRRSLEEYDFEDINTFDTPLQANFYDELMNHKDDPILIDNRYRNMIGTLQFLANRTRPDVATAYSVLSQYNAKPNAFLLKCIKRVYGYLKGTDEYKLVYKAKQSQVLNFEFYSDSDFAGDQLDRKSRSGWVGFLNGCAFIWGSCKQTSVAKSTAEAEYISMSHSTIDIVRMREFMSELGFVADTPTTLYGDNVAATTWSNSTSLSRKAKHIEIRYHYIRSKVQDRAIAPAHVSSEENIADGLTKPLDKIKFNLFRTRLGVVHVPDDQHQEGC